MCILEDNLLIFCLPLFPTIHTEQNSKEKYKMMIVWEINALPVAMYMEQVSLTNSQENNFTSTFPTHIWLHYMVTYKQTTQLLRPKSGMCLTIPLHTTPTLTINNIYIITHAYASWVFINM